VKTLDDNRFGKGQKKLKCLWQKYSKLFCVKKILLEKGRVNSFEGCWLFRRQCESESDQVGIKIFKGECQWWKP
jgi:hypothetical protein